MSSLKVLALAVACLSFVALVNCAEFTPCPTEAKFGKLNHITVTNCNSNDAKCPFQTGKNVSMELTFETTQDFESAKIKIAGILSAIPVPFRINPDTVCSYGAVCPLKAAQNNTIHLEFPIKSTYPKIQLVVQVSLSAPTGESIVCVRFPAHIV